MLHEGFLFKTQRLPPCDWQVIWITAVQVRACPRCCRCCTYLNKSHGSSLSFPSCGLIPPFSFSLKQQIKERVCWKSLSVGSLRLFGAEMQRWCVWVYRLNMNQVKNRAKETLKAYLNISAWMKRGILEGNKSRAKWRESRLSHDWRRENFRSNQLKVLWEFMTNKSASFGLKVCWPVSLIGTSCWMWRVNSSDSPSVRVLKEPAF